MTGTDSGIWECGIHTTKLRIDNKGIKALATKAEGETAKLPDHKRFWVSAGKAQTRCAASQRHCLGYSLLSLILPYPFSPSFLIRPLPVLPCVAYGANRVGHNEWQFLNLYSGQKKTE